MCVYRNRCMPIKTIVIEIKHKYNNKYSLWGEIFEVLSYNGKKNLAKVTNLSLY